VKVAAALYCIQLAKLSLSQDHPPRHGDEIAEPLMRHFMRNQAEIRRCVASEFVPASVKKAALSEVIPPQCSIAAGTARQSDQVKLRQWVFHAESNR